MPLPEAISATAYRFIVDHVYQHSRIRLGQDKQSLVVNRLGRRVRQLGLNSFDEYCLLLRSAKGRQEVGPLVDLISTNHTRFFRETRHLQLLRERIVPEWIPRLASTAEPFRLWSAACSSGEEAYSIAMILAEIARGNPTLAWQIEASDISTRMLKRAQEGIYAREQITLPTTELLPRYFQRGTGSQEGYYRVKEMLRARIRFHHLNLLQACYPIPNQQHVIFCRNVMIYFDTATQQELVAKMTAKLCMGGYLIVGHSESLLGISHTLRQVMPSVYVRAPR